MARYDVFARREGDGYLLDVQADLLESLTTRIVVPLLPILSAPRPAARLNPVFSFSGSEMVMVTQFISAVPIAIFGARIGNLAAEHDAIIAALDMALQGF